jgi:phosphoribosylaminoimidazolecarboxamide formyltransferase/IMP cyclohydrolase
MTEPTPSATPRRALLSAYDKTGMVELGRALVDLGWELVSSGGTARVLADAGLPVMATEEVTGFPEMLGHRVVTLHPAIHGGILADRTDPSHVEDMATYGVTAIDLVAVNLYPFSSEPSIELIDIGGPAMVRGAAKNHSQVTVLVDPADYEVVLEELRSGGEVTADTRRRLARDAFAHTAAYDAAIVAWFDDGGPGRVVRHGSAAGDAAPVGDPDPGAPLRGEPASGRRPVLAARGLLLGRRVSSTAARRCRTSTSTTPMRRGGWCTRWATLPTAVVIKHANPCGARPGPTSPVPTSGARVRPGVGVRRHRGAQPDACRSRSPRRWRRSSPRSSSPRATSRRARGPGGEEEPPSARPRRRRSCRRSTSASISGGCWCRPPTSVSIDRSGLDRADGAPADRRRVARPRAGLAGRGRVTSNTIVLVKDGQAVGIGAGQQNRRDAGRIAAEKAAGRAVGGACASDAFFPFRDGLDAAARPARRR